MLNETLLIVDDDATFTQVLAQAMSKRFNCVLTANSIATALDIAKANPPDKIVLDLKIEQDSGLSIIEPLIELSHDVSIVMLTGYSSIATTVQAMKLGAINYLCKPASAEEIMAAFNTNHTAIDTTIEAAPPSVSRLQWEHIQKVLAENNGNVSATARALGMHRRTLQRRLQKKPVKN